MKILDFISSKKLQQIQDLFSNATGLAAICVDADGKYITKGSNFTDFCMKYTRGSSVGKQRCEKCDAECTGTYFCHAGLMDFSEDIMVNGEKVGAIIGGQVLPKQPDFEQFERTADELSIPRDKYIEALKKIPVKSEQSIRDAANLLGQIFHLLVNNEYKKSINDNALSTLEKELFISIQSSQEIKRYADMLDSIATKQNILSLNASIESARSGTAGAGFAVVAGQMGELARDSAGIYNHIKSNADQVYAAMVKISNTKSTNS